MLCPRDSVLGGGNNNHVFTSQSQLSSGLRNTIHDNPAPKLPPCCHAILEGNDEDNVDLSWLFSCLRNDVEAMQITEAARTEKEVVYYGWNGKDRGRVLAVDNKVRRGGRRREGGEWGGGGGGETGPGKRETGLKFDCQLCWSNQRREPVELLVTDHLK